MLTFQETNAGSLTLTALFAMWGNEIDNWVRKTYNSRHSIYVDSPQLGTFCWEFVYI